MLAAALLHGEGDNLNRCGAHLRRFGIRLFDILDLLAKLLDFHAQFETNGGQARIVRFGAQRIGFASDFLSEKVKPASNRSAPGQKIPRGGAMSLEPVQFFHDIRLCRQHQRFLMQAILIEMGIAGKNFE